MNHHLLLFSYLVNFLVLNLSFSFLSFGLPFLLRQLFRSPRLRSLLFFYALSLPPLLSLLILVASLLPAPFILEDHQHGIRLCLGHPYHHLCLFDSPVALPASLPFRLMLGVSLVLICYSLFHSLMLGWKSRSHLSFLGEDRSCPQEKVRRRLLWLSSRHPFSSSLPLRLVPSSFPVSFLSGIFRPQLLLSSGLLQLLSLRHLQALIYHEIAHYLRRDNLNQLLLSFCKGLLLFCPTVHLLFRWWREEAELCCDELAIRSTGRPLDLAEALLEVGRRIQGLRCSRLQAILRSTFFPGDPSSSLLERRIRNILAFCEAGKPISPLVPEGSDCLGGLAALTLFCFLFLFLLDVFIHPLFLHCQLERIIRLLLLG